MKHLIIIGVGGFAREVYFHAQGSAGYGKDWDLKGFLDGDAKLADEEYKKLELPILGNINDYEVQKDDVFVCAVGKPAIKAKLVRPILERGGEFINVIHKSVTIHETAKIGNGNIIVPGSAIHADAVVGDHVALNGSCLGHDARVGDYSTLSGLTYLLGYASVGKKCFFGHGAVAMPHSKIEDNVFVGVLSVVFKRAKAGTTVFGNPALPI